MTVFATKYLQSFHKNITQKQLVQDTVDPQILNNSYRPFSQYCKEIYEPHVSD